MNTNKTTGFIAAGLVLLANTVALSASTMVSPSEKSMLSPSEKVNTASIEELTKMPHVANQLVVRLDMQKRSKADASLAAIRSLSRGRIRWESQLVPGLMVLDIDESVAKGLEVARSRAEGVLYSHPSYVLHTMDSDDPKWEELWGLKNTGQDVQNRRSDGTYSLLAGIPGIDIRVEEAWTMQPNADGVVVAVIDNGVDIEHEDLMETIWTNEDELPFNGQDDDGNGYVDDVHGWNFVNDQADSVSMNHGTHTSGTIAAIGDNDTGIIGVAPGATIMPAQFLGENGGTTANAMSAIEYVVQNGARISNNSWGGGGYHAGLYEVMATAGNEYDHLFVIAAGNDGSNCSYPAAYDLDCIISVAAVQPDGQLANFSNRGPGVDLAAPGWGIVSSFADDQYEAIAGTSMAAPHVAGVAALLLARSNGAASAADIKQAILTSVHPLNALSGTVETGGMLDAAAAIAAFDAGPIEPAEYGLLEHTGQTPAHTSVTFEPHGVAFDTCREEGVTTLPVVPNGENLSLNDDTSSWVDLDWTFSYAGRSFERVQVHSNGSITFSDAPWLFEPPSIENFSTAPRIAPMYTDLDPSVAGSVRVNKLEDRIAFTWHSVPAYSTWGTEPANTMQLELFRDGRIRMTWLDIPAFSDQQAIIGLGGEDVADQQVDLHNAENCGDSTTPGGSCAEDVDADGRVGVEDLIQLLEAWGQCD